jgi:GNAT superfamily N-acetyltransferase
VSAVVIRPATEADAPAIARVHFDSWVDTYGSVFPPRVFEEFSLESRERLWRRTASEARSDAARRTELLVAEDDGVVVGFVSLGPFRLAEGGHVDSDGAAARTAAASDRGELNAIYLAPTTLRRGLGRALFDAGRRWLREAGYVDMRLWVITGNPAVFFYRSMGGVLVEEKNFDLHGVTLSEQCYRFELRPPEEPR